MTVPDFKLIGFQHLIQTAQAEGNGYKYEIPPTWRQGRTTYGGLTTGFMIDAVQRLFPDVPPLRSMQINFVGPVTENPVVTARTLRQGKNVTSIQSDAYAGDALIATASFIFGTARDSVLTQTLPAPNAPAPKDVEAFIPEIIKSFVPKFLNNFDIGLIEGGRPGTGHEAGYTRVWARHLDDCSREGLASFLAIGDVLPPAAVACLSQVAPVSSVNWSVNMIHDDPQTGDGWWHVETRLTAAQDGYSSQVMRYWNSDGELVAEAVQSVAIFA